MARLKRLLGLIALAASTMPTLSWASVIVTNSTQFNTGYTVSNTDLLQTDLASTASVGSFSREGEAGLSALTNGSYGTQGNQGSGNGGAATADGSNTVTYTLNSGTFGTGYTIQSVATYAGWDNFRGGQSYTLSYSTIFAPGVFIGLATEFNNAGGGGNTNTSATITDTTGTLAQNVASLRFTFGGTLSAGYAGYREIDVFGLASGLASAPEPSALLLLGTGLLGLGIIRKRMG
jgi:hypothetical protein